MAEQYKSLHPLKYYRDYIAHGIRPDGRKLEQFRPMVVNLGSIATADGSALVKIGDTTVICGIKAELCLPKAETPDQGFLVTNVELTPLCSPKFRPGPPSEQAQILSYQVHDIIKNSKCLDLKQLCIFPDKLAWCLYADLICLNYDGCVVDACVVALVAALKSVKLPTVDFDPALDNKLVNLDERKALNIEGTPVCTTFAVFADKTTLTDPTDEEETLCSGILSIVMKDGSICSVHKPGGTPLTEEEILNCIDSAKERSTSIRNLITSALIDV